MAPFGDSIEQTFTAAIGSTQTVSLDLFEGPFGLFDHTFQIDILDSGGAVIKTVTQVVLAGTTVPVSFTFVPTTATSSIRITLTNSTGSVNSDGYADNVSIVCFAAGTLIATINGLRPVQDLTVGDRVITMDNGYQEIRWIGSNKVHPADLRANPKLVPIRIQAGSLGNGTPEQDLLVSPQHRVLVSSKIAERMFDANEVLIPANKLLAIDGINIASDTEENGVEYWHFLFDAHQVVWSNGAPTESLFTGPEALKSVSPQAREEILTLFPKIALPGYVASPARYIPEQGKLMKKLTQRHQKNCKPLA